VSGWSDQPARAPTAKAKQLTARPCGPRGLRASAATEQRVAVDRAMWQVSAVISTNLLTHPPHITGQRAEYAAQTRKDTAPGR